MFSTVWETSIDAYSLTGSQSVCTAQCAGHSSVLKTLQEAVAEHTGSSDTAQLCTAHDDQSHSLFPGYVCYLLRHTGTITRGHMQQYNITECVWYRSLRTGMET